MTKYFYIFICWLAFCIPSVSQAQQSSGSTDHSNISDAEIERASILLPSEDINKRIKQNMFVRVVTNKKACYVGEPLLVTYKLFTRLQSHSKVVDAPTFTGCSVVEMTTNDLKEEDEVVNGKVYKTYVIRKVQLFPLQEGLLQLGKATLENDVELYQQTTEGYKNISQKIELKNDSVTLQVNPLPSDSEKHMFTGVVGKFFILAKVTKTIDTANDNNSLELKITGSGNFMNMVCPTIVWPANIQGYEPQASEILDKLSFPVLGEKKFIIPFTCKKVGDAVIPPITFTYFDADAKNFISVQSDSIHITVKPEISLIDSTKLSPEITNIKYLWIIPFIASIVGLVFSYYSLRKRKIITKSSVSESKENSSNKENLTNYNEKLAALMLIDDNKVFYSEAKLLASHLKESSLTESNMQVLNSIISLCNEALYAPVNANKDYIITTLQNIISSFASL